MTQVYSLQNNRKNVEGRQHPDRDAHFRFIAKRVGSLRHCGEPAISIDTKKKETLGKGVPYGIYDTSLAMGIAAAGHPNRDDH